jgi:hypothetical protein
MATQPVIARDERRQLVAEKVAVVRNLRALAWRAETLYASRGYTLLAAEPERSLSWREVGEFSPAPWRRVTARNQLTFRLFRDGFHALAVHPCGNLIAAVPGLIVTLPAGEKKFQVTHRISRGTRPLHITAAPDGRVFWGEYFDNPERNEVRIYVSHDGGATWSVACEFPAASIRHIHNIVYDRWDDCLWVFTGDYGRECRVIRASLDFRIVEEALAGNQQARAVAAVVREDGVYFASDTPLEQNHIFHLDRRGNLMRLCEIASSSINACRNRAGMFFSTMVEPSDVNHARDVKLMASGDRESWVQLASWPKDRWPMRFFQYGNVFLPDGENETGLLAASTIAVKGADVATTIWRTSFV